MTPTYFLQTALIPALGLLPARMDSTGARAMVIAICLQESRLEHRRQIGGPARGYAQFEHGGGVRGVLTHPASKPHIRAVLTALDYDPESDAEACWVAIEHNDILAAAFARLLLWTLPGALPERDQPDEGWGQYLSAWKPGKPHRASWDAFYAQTWDLVWRPDGGKGCFSPNRRPSRKRRPSAHADRRSTTRDLGCGSDQGDI